MKLIPSTWFDGEVRDKVTTERQSGIIQAYLKGYIGVEDTAMIAALAVRHRAISTGDLSQDVSQFWRFLVHIVSEWPSEHAKILNLLDHFRKIPSTKHSEAERMYWGEAYVTIVGGFELGLYIPVFWNILQEYSNSPCTTDESLSYLKKDIAIFKRTNINLFVEKWLLHEALSGL